jgi:hypothetical protein
LAYAFNDLIDFTFWPYAYDIFWPAAFDETFAGIYGSSQYYPLEYAARTGGSPGICAGNPRGFTDFPIERIAQQVELDQNQRSMLDSLKAATGNAVSILQAACPTELPSTPPGRIASMQKRVEAMLQAVKMVRPALEELYQSLTDEQKERFNAIAQDTETAQTRIEALCSGRWARNVVLPTEQIERSLHLSSDQQSVFKDLSESSAKAAEMLKANCPPQQALTPTGRLAAMEDRLNTVLQAVNLMQIPLGRFYQSLNDEQKAHFNRFGYEVDGFGESGRHEAQERRKINAAIDICRC